MLVRGKDLCIGLGIGPERARTPFRRVKHECCTQVVQTTRRQGEACNFGGGQSASLIPFRYKTVPPGSIGKDESARPTRGLENGPHKSRRSTGYARLNLGSVWETAGLCRASLARTVLHHKLPGKSRHCTFAAPAHHTQHIRGTR